MSLIDLHCHTSASDGIKSPPELIDFAIDSGVEVIAITDHDTVSGIEPAALYAQGKKIIFIPGIEFSVEYPGGSFHLVGLYINPGYEPLLKKTAHLQGVRDKRIYRIIDNLADHGIRISLEEVLEESGGGAMGRPHVARVLVKHGYARNMGEVFGRYMVRGMPGYVSKEKIKLDEAVSLIAEAGGIPIVAHPVSLNFGDYTRFENILKGFIDSGVVGIEAYSSMHRASDVREFIRLAKKYSMLLSGGSDYHGDKDERLGYYMPSAPIPFEVYSNLRR